MQTFLVGLATLIVGVSLGYATRLTEFRRERRLAAYGDLVGGFLGAAHSGAALHSMHTQLGEKMFAEENREEASRYWAQWGDDAQSFEVAAARVRLVGSKRMREATEELESFINANVRKVPPLYRTASPSEWGDAAQVGPARVDSEAVRLAVDFADRARPELTRWRQPN